MRQLPAADRRTLLRLMSDECYQQTKLGAAFPPSKQQRSGQFWLLAAAYLEQPVLSVVLAGACLRAEADALRLQQRQRQRQRQEREAVLPSVPGAAARRQPQVAAATTDTAAAAERALLMPAVETAAAGGSSDGSKRRRKDKEERLRRKAEAAEAAAAAERGSSGPAQAPPGAAELPQRLAKKRRRQKVGSGDTRSPPAALPSTPALAAAAEEQQPAKKKRRREAGSNQPAEAGAALGLRAAAELEEHEQQAPPYDPYSGAFAAFRPTAAALERRPSQPAQRQPAAVGTEPRPFSGAFAAFAPAAGPGRAAAVLQAGSPAASVPAAQPAAPAAAAAICAHPPSANRRWRPEADAKLLLLADSAEHRQQVLGSSELNWEAIGRRLGRSGSAAQDRFYRLRRAASDAQAGAGSAAAAAAAATPAAGRQQQQQPQLGTVWGGSTASAGASGQLAGGSCGAAAQPVRAAIMIGLPSAAAEQQHESPPFVGVKFQHDCLLCWGSDHCVGPKQWRLASCATRAAAAAAHVVAHMWCLLHKQGKGEEFRNVNFPQLLEDAALEQQLRGLADVPALKAFLATWLAQQWPQLEAAMLAGRAAALDRYIAANSKRRGVYRHGAGWQASIGLQGKTCGLGTFPTEEEAGVVRDIASVWRSLHFRSTKASQLYNQPQLRLWEDAALVTSLRGVQSSAQLQSFLKAWAEQHLPAVVARLA